MKKRNAGLGLALALMLTMGAQAQLNTSWTNTAGGDFNAPANWSPNVDPNGSGTNTFSNLIAASPILLSANVSSRGFYADGTSTFTLDLNGFTYATTDGANAWTIGNNSGTKTVTFKSSLPGGQMTMPHMRIGPVSSTINVNFTGSNLTVHAGAVTDIHFLQNASGTIKLSDGVNMILDFSTLIGRSGTTESQVRNFIVTDPGTLLRVTGGQFNVGKGGQGTPTATVSNGAVGRFVGVYLGIGGDNATLASNNTNANGRLIVTGSGSTVTASSDFYLGDVAGNVAKTAGGYLDIHNGGVMTVTGMTRIAIGRISGATWTNYDSYGRITVSNANSALDIRGNYLQVGIEGYGDVVVADNAKLTVTNHSAAYIQLAGRSTLKVSDAQVETKRLLVASNSTIRLELGAQNHATPYIQMYSNLTRTAGAKLEIAFLDDFDYGSLSYLSEVSLFKLTGMSGSFDGWVSGVTTITSGGYDFQYNEYNATDGEIYLTVIPEPATLGLIGAGLGLAALIRRRRG